MRVSPTTGQLIYHIGQTDKDHDKKKLQDSLSYSPRFEARTPRVQIRMANSSRNVGKSGHYCVPVVMTVFVTQTNPPPPQTNHFNEKHLTYKKGPR